MKYVAPLVLLTLILGLTAGYVSTLKKTIKPVFAPYTANSKKESPWKIYTNTVNGYSFSYPSEWNISQEWDIRQAAHLNSIPDGSIWQQIKLEGNNQAFEVVVWENASGVPARTWVSWFRHEDLNLENVPEEPNATVSGIPSILYTQGQTARKKPLSYYFLTDHGVVYELVFESVAAEVRSRIVADFRLLDKPTQ